MKLSHPVTVTSYRTAGPYRNQLGFRITRRHKEPDKIASINHVATRDTNAAVRCLSVLDLALDESRRPRGNTEGSLLILEAAAKHSEVLRWPAQYVDACTTPGQETLLEPLLHQELLKGPCTLPLSSA